MRSTYRSLCLLLALVLCVGAVVAVSGTGQVKMGVVENDYLQRAVIHGKMWLAPQLYKEIHEPLPPSSSLMEYVERAVLEFVLRPPAPPGLEVDWLPEYFSSEWNQGDATSSPADKYLPYTYVVLPARIRYNLADIYGNHHGETANEAPTEFVGGNTHRLPGESTSTDLVERGRVFVRFRNDTQNFVSIMFASEPELFTVNQADVPSNLLSTDNIVNAVVFIVIALVLLNHSFFLSRWFHDGLAVLRTYLFVTVLLVSILTGAAFKYISVNVSQGIASAYFSLPPQFMANIELMESYNTLLSTVGAVLSSGMFLGAVAYGLMTTVAKIGTSLRHCQFFTLVGSVILFPILLLVFFFSTVGYAFYGLVSGMLVHMIQHLVVNGTLTNKLLGVMVAFMAVGSVLPFVSLCIVVVGKFRGRTLKESLVQYRNLMLVYTVGSALAVCFMRRAQREMSDVLSFAIA